jgi:Putative rhamnosyl transferase
MIESTCAGGEGSPGQMQRQDSLQHIVITRYFVQMSEAAADVNAILSTDETWLDARFEIFKAFCLPSVVAQTVKGFTWLIFFDAATPGAQLNRVRNLVAEHPFIRIVLCTSFDDDTRAEAVRAELRPETRWLLTTRLDNDDGWRRDFVERLHEQLRFERREFLNYPVGLLYYADKTFLYRHPSNAFISLLEPVEHFTTVWCDQHVNLSRHAPIRQLPPSPTFIQVVHKGTRSNKPRGVRIHRFLALPGFEAIAPLAGEGPPENDWGIFGYNGSVALLWAVRDAIAAAVRRLLGRASG